MSSISKQELEQALHTVTALSNQVKRQKEHKNAPKYSFEHLAIHGISRRQIIRLFGDIRFILVMGSAKRAKTIAEKAYTALKLQHSSSSSANEDLQQIGTSAEQTFKIFKVGAHILCCSHGMGLGSVSLFMNELLRLMSLAKNLKFRLLRIGSSGGIGVTAGTLIITSAVCDPVSFKPEWVYNSCGHQYRQECIIDQEMVQHLAKIACARKIAIEIGKSVTVESFYEGQARLDGSLCTISKQRKQEYLSKLYAAGARNFEMECSVVTGMCSKYQIKCGMICVALINRLEDDSIAALHTLQETQQWMDNAIQVVLQYIYHYVLQKSH